MEKKQPTKRRPGRPAAYGRGISPTVYITRPDADKLEAIAEKRRVSVCEVIRRILHEHLEEKI